MSKVEAPELSRTLAHSHTRTFGGWATPIALGVITAVMSVLNPTVLIVVPLAFMLVALPARKLWLVMVALALLATTFTGKHEGVLWWYARGWALILSAWFVLLIALLPDVTLMSRALAAVAGAAASVGLLFVANHAGWYQLDWAVGTQLRNGAADVISFWTTRMQDKPWLEDLNNAIYRFTDFQTLTYPALLALASLSGLALAWWLWRRFAAQDDNPLGRLRDFRFRDELVWIVVVGAALVALPLQAAATRTGANLLTFMAALYTVRGVAVLLSLFGSPGVIGALFGALLLLMLYPIVMATTLMVGLSDTWLDLRAKRLTRQDHEKH